MSEQIKSFGLRECQIAPVVTDTDTETTYGEFVQAIGIQELSITPVIEEYELLGDDQQIEADAVVTAYEFSATNAVLSMEQLKVLTGANYEDVLNNTGEKIGEVSYATNTDALGYFGLVGRVAKDGTLKRILYKCKATGGVEVSHTQGDYAVVTFSGRALARTSDGRFMATKKVSTLNEKIKADDLV